MVATQPITKAQVWDWLEGVPDPEIPVISVVDLGVIRDVDVAGEDVTVTITPTYSGCPATEVIEDSIVSSLTERGVPDVSVRRVLSPAWTTDWITDAGRQKLREYGIAPPEKSAGKRELMGKTTVACPRCASEQTTLVSEFGSTACKAAWKCDDCLEPFEYFKCI